MVGVGFRVGVRVMALGPIDLCGVRVKAFRLELGSGFWGFD